MPTYEISDEALEAAAGMGGMGDNFTQVACTNLPDCPVQPPHFPRPFRSVLRLPRFRSASAIPSKTIS